MEIRSTDHGPAKIDADAVVVGLYSEGVPLGPAEEIDQATEGLITRLVKSEEITGKANEVVSLLEQIPVAVNGNYVLSDGDGETLDIEATGDGPEIIRDNGAGFIAHTNHYVCNKYANDDNHAKCTKDSFTRLNRINSLIREKYGSISVEDVKTFLSDHDHHPTSICRHPQTADAAKGFETSGMTAASIVAEPAQRRMHVSLGNPCENAFATYSMNS